MATTTALPRKKIQSRNKVSQDIPDIPQRTRELFLYAIALFGLLTGFYFNSPNEILDGLLRIQLSPSVLLSDFMEIRNIGAALYPGGQTERNPCEWTAPIDVERQIASGWAVLKSAAII